MARISQSQLTPRDGQTLKVLIVARISGCAAQKDVSLEDQVDHAKDEVAQLYQGAVEYKIISTRGKGESRDRPELTEVENLLRTGRYDVLAVDDLGRLVRGTTSVDLLGIAVDHGTRAIAINDCIDTADPTWEEDAIAACRDHVGHNAHTSKRLKQKMMKRFARQGACTANLIFGYIKPQDAATYHDWSIDPKATPILQEGARLLLETGNCSIAADFFNQQGISVGPYCRNLKWDGRMIRRLYGNPLLKGVVGRGYVHTVKHHETGKRVCVKNPQGPTLVEFPHLAQLTEELFDELNCRLDKKNNHFRRRKVNGKDPWQGRHRSESSFPGQHAICTYCGRKYVWGGNGVTDSLMCTGSRDWHCWNSIAVKGPLARRLVCEAIYREFSQLDGFAEQFREILEQAAHNSLGNADQLQAEIEREQRELDRKKQNLASVMLDHGQGEIYQMAKKAYDDLDRALRQKRRQLDKLTAANPDLPDSITELKALFEKTFAAAAEDSLELTILLRKLVPKFEVHLVRSIRGGHLLAQASLTLHLDGLVPDARMVPGLSQMLTRELTIDLFEPAQPERIREEVVRLARQGVTRHEIVELIAERPTLTAVQAALNLQRLMEERGMDSPYVRLEEPPEDYPKLRRHKNKRYEFRPVSEE